jgi:argininosuccinate lyase
MKPSKGRFRAPLNPQALAFSTSLPVDRRLYAEDIDGSIAHVTMLGKQKIIPVSEAKRIQQALGEIKREMERGKWDVGLSSGRFAAEDIHMAIEARLVEKIGPIGGKLHTARSRNDQVALDERLYMRKAARHIMMSIRSFQRAMLAKAGQYKDVIMPGYTHMQRAQPVLLAHHLMAYVSMIDRDYERFEDCLKRIQRSPLGTGALAGTSFPIDRRRTARVLGFEAIIENSIDAVSDRDVLIEFIAHCSIVMMHLSRFAEELVLWSSQEWRFAEIGEAFTTGSSIMPQKKNPDMAELVRGKTGRVYGDLIALLTVMKGLPLAYNRDMQEDKEPLFDAADTLQSSLNVFTGMVKTLAFNRERFTQELQMDFLLATDLADYLVRKGMPFRKAHAVVGSIVRDCIAKKKSLTDMALPQFQHYSRLFERDTHSLLSPSASVSSKRSAGSTSQREVQRIIEKWRRRLD